MLQHLARLPNLWHHKTMNSIDSAKKPKKGRPPVDTVAVNVRLHEDVIARVDDWRRVYPNIPTRPEAIRRLLIFGILADKTVADLQHEDLTDDPKFEKKFLQKMVQYYKDNHPAEDWFDEIPD